MAVTTIGRLLFPKSSVQYQQVSDGLVLKERQAAVDQGGDILNPQTYSDLANQAAKAAMNSGLSANQRRDLHNKSLDYQARAMNLQNTQLKGFETSEIESWITEDINQLTYDVPGNPYLFARTAYDTYSIGIDGGKTGGEKVWPGLNGLIDSLRDLKTDTSSLSTTLQKWIDERSKYATIKNAFEKDNPQQLENYVLVYTPSVNGKVMRMEIVERTNMKGTDSNFKFSGLEDDGTTAKVVPALTATGLRIKLVDPNISSKEGKIVNFAGVQGKLTSKGGEAGQDIFELPSFNLNQIRKEPLHNLPPGSFAEDTTGKFYHVNQDGTFSPVANDYTFEQLGGKTKPIYQMNKQDEVNLKAGTIGQVLDLQTLPKEYKESIMADYEAQKAKQSGGFWGAAKKMIGVGVPGIPSLGFSLWPQKAPATKVPTEQEMIQQRTKRIISGQY